MIRAVHARFGRVSGIVPLLLLFAVEGALADSQLPCEADDALQDAAVSILLTDEPVNTDALVSIAREAGSDVTAVRGLRLIANDRAVISEWLRRTERELDADVICGVAEGREGLLILAGARAGALMIEPGNPIVVRARLAEEYTRPRLVLRDGRGELQRIDYSPDLLERGVSLPEGLASPVRVQLMADGPTGPRPVAERVIRFGDSSSSRVGVSQQAPITVDRAAWITSAREAEGALPLRTNRILAEAARAHARAVCDSGRVGHELDPGADPEMRLRRRGIVARVVGEVVARADDPEAAHRALLESPSHHLTLVDSRFTDHGYGMVEDSDGHVCTVVLLAAWPRVIPR